MTASDLIQQRNHKWHYCQLEVTSKKIPNAATIHVLFLDDRQSHVDDLSVQYNKWIWTKEDR